LVAEVRIAHPFGVAFEIIGFGAKSLGEIRMGSGKGAKDADNLLDLSSI
jgi:hypothetical protein